jgi:hypothetical protein
MSFEDLKTHRLVELNKFIHEAKVEDIMSALNKASVKTKNIAPPARKKVFKNKSNSNVEIIIKKLLGIIYTIYLGVFIILLKLIY